MGSVMLQHLPSAWHVDQAIVRPTPHTSHFLPLLTVPPARRRSPHSLHPVRFRRRTHLHGHGREALQDRRLDPELRRRVCRRQQGITTSSLCSPHFPLSSTATDNVQQVPDFNAMYEIYDPCTVMFFWRNRHMQVDFGTGNNNKINFAIGDKQELIDIVEAVYRGASKGKGLVVSPKDYSTKWMY